MLTIHGVDGIGWEALSHRQLSEYFNYIKSRESKLWVATFGDVTRYMRERQSAKVTTTSDGNITVTLSHTLNKAMYNVPLTLKTYVPAKWKTVKIMQGDAVQVVKTVTASGKAGPYVIYRAKPNGLPVILKGV